MQRWFQAWSRRLGKLVAMEMSVRLGWEAIGHVQVEGQSLRFPRVPREPGIYQFVFRHAGRERMYVGEAVDLARRFQHYATPGPSQTTNLRMRDRALRVVEAGGTMSVSIARDIAIGNNGDALIGPDLASEFVRRFIENAVLVEALLAGRELINGKGHGQLREDAVLG